MCRKSGLFVGLLTLVVVFITSLNLMVYFSTETSERKSLSPAYTNFSYKIFPYNKTWKDALKSCLAVESRLVEVYTKVQQSKLRKFIRTPGENYLPKDEFSGYWLGGVNKKGNWTWVSTSQYLYESYASGWQINKPDHGQKKNCMEMQLIKNRELGESLSWNNIDCKVKRHYICEGFHFK